MYRKSVLVLVLALLIGLGAMDTTAQAPDSFVLGTMTVGGPTHLTGATLDVIGPDGTAGGASLITQDSRRESFLAFFNRHIDGPINKTASISTRWAEQRTAYGVAVTRINTGYVLAGRQWDNLGFVQWGGMGTAIGCNDDNIALAPGAGNLRVCGDIILGPGSRIIVADR